MKGLIIKTFGNQYNVEINKNIFRCVYRGKNKVKNQFKNPLISGDIVDIKMLDDGTGVIEKVYKRKNYFIKKSLKESQPHLIGSNIDYSLILASLKEPYTKLKFIDKCLATSIYNNIKPIIIFNKIDILNERDIIKLNNILKIYQNIGLKTFTISVKKNVNIKELEDHLKYKKSIILGNSGVGKSTLINSLSINSNQKTDDLSIKTGRGKQTTTFSEIFRLKCNGIIIDTPGFKDFEFYDIDKNTLKFLYPEFNNIGEKCKFNNCLHLNEPKCKIKEKLDIKISLKRYNNYLSILKELN